LGNVAREVEGSLGGRETFVRIFLEDGLETCDGIVLEDVNPVGERNCIEKRT